MEASTISEWRMGPVYIYPDKSWKGCLNKDNLREVAHLIKKDLSDLNVKVWDQSSYTCETNGPWNVTISIESKSYNYIYMIRKDEKFNKTYGCPMYNSEYSKELPLTKKCNENLFNRLSESLTKILGTPDIIDYFLTKKPDNIVDSDKNTESINQKITVAKENLYKV